MASNTKILLVDDEDDMLMLGSDILRRKGYRVTCATNAIDALGELKRETYTLIIADVVMPKMDGIDLLKMTKQKYPETEVIMVTGHGTIENAVEAMKQGAHGYLLKPVEPEVLLAEVAQIEELRNLRDENLFLKEELSRSLEAGEMVGGHPSMTALRETIRQVASSDSTALIYGESGTGKELVARAIHYQSTRRSRPFVRVNCPSLSETLLESELFGHEKGAFTGALQQKPGRFERAEGGTLFLDEIGAIAEHVQAKLLRVLQEREFERVGGTETISVDVRLITATNRDIEKTAQRAAFREDFFYRLNVIPIRVPPLRERRSDIPLLAAYFIEHCRMKMTRTVTGIAPDALAAMMRYSWPGNVRELENAIERAFVLTQDTRIGVWDLPEGLATDRVLSDDARTLRDARAAFEKRHIEEILRGHRGNVSQAADTLEISRRHLQEKMRQYGIDR